MPVLAVRIVRSSTALRILRVRKKCEALRRYRRRLMSGGASSTQNHPLWNRPKLPLTARNAYRRRGAMRHNGPAARGPAAREGRADNQADGHSRGPDADVGGQRRRASFLCGVFRYRRAAGQDHRRGAGLPVPQSRMASSPSAVPKGKDRSPGVPKPIHPPSCGDAAGRPDSLHVGDHGHPGGLARRAMAAATSGSRSARLPRRPHGRTTGRHERGSPLHCSPSRRLHSRKASLLHRASTAPAGGRPAPVATAHPDLSGFWNLDMKVPRDPALMALVPAEYCLHG